MKLMNFFHLFYKHRCHGRHLRNSVIVTSFVAELYLIHPTPYTFELNLFFSRDV